MRGAARTVVAAVVTLACVVGLGACAQIPTSGAVRAGSEDVKAPVDIAMLPQGPTPGADPQTIVAGFLGAAGTAPTSPKEFQTAREFLTEDVRWDPESSVRVVRETPLPELFEDDADYEDAETVDVVVSATTIATLDSTGTYTEASDPRELDYRFSLVRTGGEWRISALDNGLLVPANLFATQYRATRLFFPAADDMHRLVPDLRWFPRRSWRSVAVQEVLAGPPEWLQGATESLVPEGTQLASPSVQDPEGEQAAVAVRLSEQISAASADRRAVIEAQLSATLSEGAGRTVPVDLYSERNRLAGDAAAVSMPATTGQALVLKGGALYRVEDGGLEPHLTPDLSGIDPTALAVSPSVEPIVVRDGEDRIVALTADDGPVTLFEGQDLAAPSVDRFGVTWTSSAAGKLRVAAEGLDEVTLEPEWLSGRTVISVSVAPEGARVAIVSEAPSGRHVQVAGIVRDENGMPTALAPPISVAASIDGIMDARWSGITALTLLTRDDEGLSGVWTAGVGGLAGTTGSSGRLSGLTDVEQLTAGVTGRGVLVVTKGGDLEHEETGVWQPFAEDVDLVAYPG